MFDDNEPELSDNLSSMSSMDVDMNPFRTDTKSDAESDRFSAQYILPLEVGMA